MASPTIIVYDGEQEVISGICKLLGEHADKAITGKGIFTVGFSGKKFLVKPDDVHNTQEESPETPILLRSTVIGGSLVRFLATGLPTLTTDWSKWRIFFCDERHVPFSSADCTYQAYMDKLGSQVPLEAGKNIFPIKPDLDVSATAEDYISQLRSVFPGDGIPRFDVLLLGMGPDGHTCSLFPRHALLKETSMLVAPITDSPKPPPSRVTLTYPVINNAACVVFVSCGSGKAEVHKRILEDDEADPLPAARVRPTNGELIWIIDTPAASQLTKK